MALEPARRAEIAARWRGHAEQFEAEARAARACGDPEHAEQFEAIAADFAQDAELLELGLIP